VTVTDANGNVSTYVFDLNSARMTSYVDPIGNWANDPTHHMTSYGYDAYGRVTQVTAPEGNQTQTVYDARGNVTQVTQVAKGNSLPNIVTSAGYDATCTVSVKCNQPNWTKDALGNQTDYTYDTTHGGVLTVTAPSADGSSNRPQTRYAYTAMQGYYLNSAGSIVASGQNTWKLTSVSVCRFASGCVNTGDELRTTISYGPQSAGTGNNLLPISQTTAAGNGSPSTTSSQTYDTVGNVHSTTDALGNTTVYHYDADRRLLGAVGPDPDGSGPRTPLARQFSYNARGVQWQDSVGTVTDQSDAAWANYSETYHNYRLLDDYDRTVRTTTWTNGVDYAVADYLYDATGKLTCTIQYMDNHNWGPYASSCTPLQTSGPMARTGSRRRPMMDGRL
jgi:YD repeat-containing protein